MKINKIIFNLNSKKKLDQISKEDMKKVYRKCYKDLEISGYLQAHEYQDYEEQLIDNMISEFHQLGYENPDTDQIWNYIRD